MKKIVSLFLAFVLCMMPFGMAFAGTNNVFNSTVTPSITMPDGLNTKAGNILGAIQGVSFFVGLFIIVFYGVKYFTAGAGEKAKTKEMLVPFLVGGVVLMLAPTIMTWIWGLFQ